MPLRPNRRSLPSFFALLVIPSACSQKTASVPAPPLDVKPLVVAPTPPAPPPGPDVLQRMRAIGVLYYRLSPEYRLGEEVDVVHVECQRVDDEGRLRRVRCKPGKLLSAADLSAEWADGTLWRVAACTHPSFVKAPLDIVREVEKASMEDRDVRLAGRYVVVRTDTFVSHSYVHGPGPATSTTTTGGRLTVALPSRFVHPGATNTEGLTARAYVPARGRGDGTWSVDERFFPPRGRKLGWSLDLERADPSGAELEQAMSTLDVAAEGPFVQLAVYANRIYIAAEKRDKPGALKVGRELSSLRAVVARWPDSENRRYLLMHTDAELKELAGLARSDVSLVDPCVP